jgi:hypothetical protein
LLHHCLLPYEALTPEEKDRNRVSVRQIFAGLLFMQCEIVPTVRMADLKSKRSQKRKDYLGMHSGLGCSTTSVNVGGGGFSR